MYKLAINHIIRYGQSLGAIPSTIQIFKNAISDAFMNGNDAMAICSETDEMTIVTSKELETLIKQMEKIISE